MAKIYDFKVLDNKGNEIELLKYAGNVIMIVNTASKCGLTPQYDGLQALYDKYKDRGFVILGFPCDQFKHQEPGSDEEIAQFCKMNYGVSFPIMKKIDVLGPNASPVYQYLTETVPNENIDGFFAKSAMKLMKKLSDGTKESDIKWNFTKFLISRDGNIIKRYAPIVKPEKIEEDIEKML